MAENQTIPELLSGVVKAVFLLCLVALIPLGVAQWYSRNDAPSETREMYDTLESGDLGCHMVPSTSQT